MSKVKMMTVAIQIRVPMFDLPDEGITKKGLAAAVVACKPEEIARYISGWKKCPFSGADV